MQCSGSSKQSGYSQHSASHSRCSPGAGCRLLQIQHPAAGTPRTRSGVSRWMFMSSVLLAPASSHAGSTLVPVRTITLNLVSLSDSVCSPPTVMPDLSEAKLPRSLPPWEDPLSELAMLHRCSSLLRLGQDELHCTQPASEQPPVVSLHFTLGCTGNTEL